ncbi:MAG: methylene-tetrahydromethanopterin dehydrogenase N-terminal domain-containing protein [Promethearchaeota archaeon]
MSDKKMILYMLDADPHPSPFDINVAYDCGYDVVIPMGKITENNIRKLIEDAMFSRGEKGSKFTKVFLNGSNHAQIKRILKIARESMIPGFELTICIDPRGGYTTGAALVAQVESDLGLIGKKELKDCKAVVFGGTGMVGQTVAILCAKNGTETTILSRSLERAEYTAEELNRMYDIQLKPQAMGDELERAKICSDKDLIFTCGSAGVQLISATTLQKIPDNKIYADSNAVPPLGIEGIDNYWKAMEYEKSYIYGALSIGKVKLKVEKLTLKEMMDAPGYDTYSFMEFYEYAKEIIQRKKDKKKNKEKI